MTGTNPTGDPPPTLPRAADSSGFVSPTFIRRKVLRAELKEIKRSRGQRGAPAQALEEIETALQEVNWRPSDELPLLTWSRFVSWMMPTVQEGLRACERIPTVREGLRSWEEKLRARKEKEKRTEWEREWNDTAIRPPDCGLVGLALSGGGIRSATVCLGVLQELARHNVLRLVDYLSTVSGGGYTGASWSGVLAKSPEHRQLVTSPDFPFVHQSEPDGEVIEAVRHAQNKEPIALVHVRDFANYLMPRGLRDQIRVPALLLRGLIINFLVLVPAIMILSAITLWAYGDAIRSADSAGLPGFVATFWLAIGCVVYLLFATGLQTARSWPWPRRLIDATMGQPEQNGWRVRRNLLGVGALLLLVLIAVAAFEATQYPVTWLARSEQAEGHAVRGPLHDTATSGSAAQAELRRVAVVPTEPAAGREVLPKEEGVWALLLSAEFWSALGAVGGVVSALVAGQAVGSSSARVRRSALAAVGVLAPLGLLVAYLWFAAWLTVFAVHDYGILVRWLGEDLTGSFYDHRLWAFVYAASAVLLWLLLTGIVDINKTSLHSYYRDRLSRAFMFRLEPVRGEGAPANSKPTYWRTRHEDEIPLSALRPSRTGGPYHLINAIVNCPDFSEENRAGTETQRGRRADFFVFAPCFCGNERLGYCRTNKLEQADPHMNLATAMAISAAAAAPNMGQKTFNPLLVFLMSMLNVRLGYWLRRPESVEHRDWIRWPVGPLYFLRELIGLPARRSAYINLSDGGHLDNTGIFELLRRRCRYIIAVDAEADPEMRFNGLATLQRLAWIDLGVEVHFDIEDLRRSADKFSRRHFALCDVIYERAADRTPRRSGKLLYIKSSMTGTEIEYIKEYWASHRTFPHETTGDQFFDEAQFEAYRALGDKMGHEVVERIQSPEEVATAKAFFDHLEHWLQPVSPLQRGLVDLVNRRRSIDERLRVDGLADYRNEIWPPYDGQEALGLQEEGLPFARQGECLWEAGETPKPPILQLVNEQIQLMELALLQLRLDDPTNWEHLRNRGWKEMFCRWSQSATFRKYWQLSIPYYSHGLEAFGANALKLPEPLHQRA